jgi:crossover junction endodeoxyribonuclease RuvC
MCALLISDGVAASPPPERWRSAREASRVGIKQARFNRTKIKTGLARRLRRNSTDVEMKLWQRLRNRQLGVDFRRQHPAGTFVLDFYCPALRLAVEVDGGQHDIEGERDRARDAWFAERGVTTLRFWNSDVTNNLAGVLESIACKIAELQPLELTPTRRWRADLPLSGGGDPRRGPA